ncbi:hypothetical protein EMA8858_01369 [Emticicia aquatica]|uniref:Glycosyltransferase RgtA/B/C/D-like domain-containing protein n=1 Tax=Emticicia aquatica TaxID=1681835 RepID=A0ABM9AP32_9BACT|nr:hypothetical protein [Emticicia aquatica]CAH0995249.1 hypothetical protein EMA8858_01369 [Emticicia aquatica]
MDFNNLGSRVYNLSNKSYKYLGIFIIVTFQVLFCSIDIKNFKDPLSEDSGTDVEQWENMSYYVAKHVHFLPYPQIELTNNDYFYPYGNTHAFQGWFLEGNFFYAFLYNNLGYGPWLNYYYAFSVFFTALSIFFLVGYFWNYQRALIVALLVSFLNFHAIDRYPHHFAYAIHHWTTISIFLDFIILKKISYKEIISLRLILFKVTIMALALGLDLSYILGFALSSFFFCAVYFLFLSFKTENQRYFKELVVGWKNQIKQKNWLNYFLIGTSLLAIWLYVPIILGIFKTIRAFHFDNPFAGGHAWSMPIRLLFPYFPFLNATFNPLQDFFHDMPEGLGAMSPGLLCLSIGLVGLCYSNIKDKKIMIPFGIFFVLSVLNHPILMPTLQWLPWCMLYRIPSRFTMIIPLFCSFMFLLGNYKEIKFQKLLTIFLVIFAIGTLEIFTVFKVRFNRPAYYYAASFRPYMDYVKNQPGEAVLDWPFCVIGGNGVGNTEGLCPIYNKSSGVHSLKRFHQKKVVGHYYGRLHPSQIKSFVDAGWGKMSEPDSHIWNESTQLIKNLTPEQWEFFTDFFKFNDFAGINLYIDLIPKTEQQEFFRRFGNPTKSTVVPIAGNVVFIPKPKSWFALVNLQKGKKIKFPCGCK